MRAIFQRPNIMEIMKRQFHPWVELGRPSAVLALCFITLGCKHRGLQVVDTSPCCMVLLTRAPKSPQFREQNKGQPLTPFIFEMTLSYLSFCYLCPPFFIFALFLNHVRPVFCSCDVCAIQLHPKHCIH